MKKSRFSGGQILAILKKPESGVPVLGLCRERGMDSVAYKWRTKGRGMDGPLMARLKWLEAEKQQLKKMYAEERLKSLQRALARDVVTDGH